MDDLDERRDALGYEEVKVDGTKAFRCLVELAVVALDPRADRKDTVVNRERAAYWLSVGAQPSGTVKNLFIDIGLMKGKKENVVTITKSRAKALADAKAKAAA